MENIEIGELRRSDLAEINRLHKTRPETPENLVAVRTKILEWIAFNNPHAGNQATYFVARDKDKIVAYHGRMPTMFNVNGDRILGYYVHDLYVDPEYRRKGLGVMLTMKLSNAIEENSSSFICLFGMTPLNYMIQRRRKYYEQDVNTYVRGMNPKLIAESFIKQKWLSTPVTVSVNLLLRIFNLFTVNLNVSQSDYEITRVDHFDEAYEQFYHKIAPQLGISSYKDSALMNWKYVNCPMGDNKVLVLKFKEKIQGVAVLSTVQNERENLVGLVMDLIVSPENSKAIRVLIKEIIRHFQNLDCDYVKGIITDINLQKQFTKMGFIKRPGTKLLLGNLNKVQSNISLKNIKNWHMNLGESDAKMLDRVET